MKKDNFISSLLVCAFLYPPAGDPVRVQLKHQLCQESICKPKIPY